MRGAKFGDRHRLRSSPIDEIEHQRVSAGGADRDREQLGLVCDGPDSVRVGCRDDVAALVFPEQDCSRVRDLRYDPHGHADVTGEGHLRDCNCRSTVRTIVNRRDQAISDESANTFAGAPFGGEVDWRWRAFAAAMTNFQP
jgi:hypothetical protein